MTGIDVYSGKSDGFHRLRDDVIYGSGSSGTSPATTLFGAYAGTLSTSDTDTYPTRLARVAGTFGGNLNVERRYMGSSYTLPTCTYQSMIASFDFDVTNTLNGNNDAAIDAIAQGYSGGKILYLVPWHEVNLGPKLSTADYKSVFQYVANRVHAIGKPNVFMTTILTSYQMAAGDWSNAESYYPGNTYVDCVGFDSYINNGLPNGNTVDKILANPIAYAKSKSKPLVIGEISFYPAYAESYWANATTGVPRIIQLLDTADTAAVAWFESNKSDGDWMMAHRPSAVPYWAAVCTR